MTLTIVNENAIPIQLMDEIINIFQLAKMDPYLEWLMKFRLEIIGLTHLEAAKKILSCYGGSGSLLDMSIGFPGDQFENENNQFYFLRDHLYKWASTQT